MRQVVANGPTEHLRILRHDAHLLVDAFQNVLTHRPTVNGELATLEIAEAKQHVDAGGRLRSTSTKKGHGVSS